VTRIALTAFLVMTASCRTMPTIATTPTLSAGDAVNTAADRDHKTGTLVEVFGTYRLVADGKDADALATDHAAIALGDGTLIRLQPPWHPDAARPADERAKLVGHAVVAKGLLFAECPPPPDGRAYARVSCLYSEIVLLERTTYDLLHGGGGLE
jgi:hypothetical protein